VFFFFSIMKTLCLLLALVVAVALAVEHVEVPSDLHKQFFDFKMQYHKFYTSLAEEEKRFLIFAENVKEIQRLNAENNVHGINWFADVSKEERLAILMNPPPLSKERPFNRTGVTASPPTFDWRSKPGVLTPVYNQLQCGSCWAFSATENMESQWALARHPLVSLSRQQIVDCDPYDYGCGGGWPYNAYKYVIGAGGLEPDVDYPYVAMNQPCKFNRQDVVAKFSSWTYTTTSQNENEMKDFLYNRGPISVCVDASQWFSYSGGVFRASQCSTGIDHCVLAIGYDTTANPPYWLIRNSWGTGWGEGGYMKLEFGANACAVAQVSTSAVV